MNKNDLLREYKLILWHDGTITIIRLSDYRTVYRKDFAEDDNLTDNLEEAYHFWLGLSTGKVIYDADHFKADQKV